MGGRQAVRPRTLDPVSKVRILPAQPVSRKASFRRRIGVSLFRSLVIFHKKIERFPILRIKLTVLPGRVREYKTQNSTSFAIYRAYSIGSDIVKGKKCYRPRACSED